MIESNESQELKAGSKIERVFVVLNPVAGLTNAENSRERISRFCEEQGWKCEIHETQPDDDLKQIVQDALKNNVDMVIAAGGDGTVSGVVTGMVNSQAPMGIIPAGTGNALARDLGVPLDLNGALNLLGREHKVAAMDVMKIGDDYYVLNVSVGLSSLTMRKTAREEKRRFGFLAYIWRALGLLAAPDMHKFKLMVDGETYQYRSTEVMVANSKLMGLQPQVKGVDVDSMDGRLDLFVVQARNTGGIIRIFSLLLRPFRGNSDPDLLYIPVKETIEITTEFPLPAQADGEDIGSTPIKIQLIPGALHVVMP